MLIRNRRGFVMKPDGAGGSGGTGGSGAAGGEGAGSGDAAKGDGQGTGQVLSYDEWYKSLPETNRKLIDEHTAGLSNTVKATREERDNLGKQVKDLLGKVEKGSDAEKQLTSIQSELEKSTRKATFLEEAVTQEVGCTNPRAAFAIAVQEDLFDKSGRPNWDEIRKISPESFQKKKTPEGGGGEGSRGSGNGNALTMDDMIRLKAGQSRVG